jgi:hypothetical protein
MEDCMSLLDELKEAADTSEAGCKLCGLLIEIPDGDGPLINDLLFRKNGEDWKISADKAVTILRGHGYSIGPTTVRRHRNQDHRRLPTER